MSSPIQVKLINFLQQELAVPNSYIEMARAREEDADFLPMVLWQYGLLDLEQLAKVFDYLKKTYLLC